MQKICSKIPLHRRGSKTLLYYSGECSIFVCFGDRRPNNKKNKGYRFSLILYPTLARDEEPQVQYAECKSFNKLRHAIRF